VRNFSIDESLGDDADHMTTYREDTVREHSHHADAGAAVYEVDISLHQSLR
jgi:hypothetical protein